MSSVERKYNWEYVDFKWNCVFIRTTRAKIPEMRFEDFTHVHPFEDAGLPGEISQGSGLRSVISMCKDIGLDPRRINDLYEQIGMGTIPPPSLEELNENNIIDRAWVDWALPKLVELKGVQAGRQEFRRRYKLWSTVLETEVPDSELESILEAILPAPKAVGVPGTTFEDTPDYKQVDAVSLVRQVLDQPPLIDELVRLGTVMIERITEELRSEGSTEEFLDSGPGSESLPDRDGKSRRQAGTNGLAGRRRGNVRRPQQRPHGLKSRPRFNQRRPRIMRNRLVRFVGGILAIYGLVMVGFFIGLAY